MNPAEHLLEKYPCLVEKDLEELLSIASFHEVQAGENLVSIGELNFNYFLVIQGLLRNSVIDSKGEERTVLFTKEGEVSGSHHCVIMNLPSIENIVTLEPGLVASYDSLEVYRLSLENTNILRLQRDSYRENLSKEINKNLMHTTMSPEKRYLHLLEESPEIL